MGTLSTVAVVSAVLLASGCGEQPAEAPSPTSPSSASPPTSAASRPSAPPPIVNPAEYASSSSRYPQWGFVTPSSEWTCVIADYPSNGSRAACAINPGEGPLRFEDMPPAQAPDPGGDPSRPNVIAVMEGADAGFLSLGRTIWESGGTPKALPDGSVLRVNGFTCNAAQSDVSCRDDQTGKGFTVSGDDFTLAYTDLPG